MTSPDINDLRDSLLLELSALKANNRNPFEVIDICKKIRPEVDWKTENALGRSAAWLLIRATPPLAKRVPDNTRPGAILLALTAAGKSQASILRARPRTKMQKTWAWIKHHWIAVVTLVVGIAALIVSIFELRKN